MIRKDEVTRINKKYKFRCQFINGQLLIISKFDTWRVEYNSGRKRPYTLLHKNNKHNINKYHIQATFKDIPWLFKSIRQHDNFKLDNKYNIYNRIDYLLKQASNT